MQNYFKLCGYLERILNNSMFLSKDANRMTTSNFAVVGNKGSNDYDI